MPDEFDQVKATLGMLMIQSFAQADQAGQEQILHDHLEQLHLLCSNARPGAMPTLAHGFIQTVSEGSDIICEHCQKAARLLAEYLETMEANNAFHEERRRIREALESD
jgi:hypothetical protein